MNDRMTRRVALLRALQLPLGGVALLSLNGCGADSSAQKNAEKVCADPQTLTAAELSMRNSLSYVEGSPNPQQICAGCAYFHAATESCGTCDMFNRGAVSSQGHCSSWSARG